MLTDFLEAGFEVQNVLRAVALSHARELDITHPNFSKLYRSPLAPFTLDFMRVISYDGYVPGPKQGAVAKPHYDRGGLTIQAYADAPGFWAAKDGHQAPKVARVPYDTHDGEAYFFLGSEHDKVYGNDSYLHKLWHGVDRVIPEGATFVPRRHSVILFTDAPHVDHKITKADTLPSLHHSDIEDDEAQVA